MLAPSAVRLPALVFSQGLILLINSLDEIKTCTKLGFKKGFYKNLVLVDSDGNKFRVVDARKLRTLRFRLRFRDFLELLVPILGGKLNLPLHLILPKSLSTTSKN